MSTHFSRRLMVPLLGLTLAATAGCTSTGSAATSDTGISPENTYTAVIDVRTAEEFTTGHVEGARNLDIRAAGFAEQIAALPTAGTYLVYCRSGARAGQAVTDMAALGLTAVNGGGVEDMRAAGFAIV